MIFRLLIASILLAPWMSWGETTQRAHVDATPIETTDKPVCRIASNRDSKVVDADYRNCVAEKKANHCEEIEKTFQDKSYIRDCRRISQCEEYSSSYEFLKSCARNWGSAWKDILTGLLGGEATPSELELIKKAEFLANCLDEHCKRTALGYYQKYFTEEELGQGRLLPAEKKELEDSHFSQDVVDKYKTKLGVPLETLLKTLFAKLRVEFPNNQKLKVPYKVPWSGRIIESIDTSGPRTISEALAKSGKDALRAANAQLDKLGIKNRACFDPLKVREMQCYAFFSIVDPTIAVGAISKINTISVKLGAKATAASIASEAKGVVARVAITDAKATTVTPLHTGLSPSYIVDLDNNSKIIFKPCVDAMGVANCNSEVAAYKVDQIAGFDLVPETVFKTIDINGSPQKGSGQLYLDFPDAESAPGRPVSQEAKIKQNIFDYLIQNTDRHDGNYLVKPNGDVVSIDHGMSFRESKLVGYEGKKLFPSHVEAFKGTAEGKIILERLANIEASELRSSLAGTLSSAEIDQLYVRIKNLVYTSKK
ncbi:MAG: hypothetical protein IT287_03020 [Bdellovibrionaceae bacterium]|nr:hypothetical protein [Pseudobdellovibrionaceae bacterium]